MSKLSMFLYRHSFAPHDQMETPQGHQAIWVEHGSLSIGEQTISAGEGTYVARNETISTTISTKFLRFEIAISSNTADLPGLAELILAGRISLHSGPAIMRLDQVTFPANARAYWHMHPGPGIRYLTCGALEIKSEDHTDIKQPGQAWFEDTNTPAQATSQNAETTAFVRAIILPPQYEGKPTIKLLNPEDEAKPALQTNKRFFDKRIEL